MLDSSSFFDFCIAEKCILNGNYEKTIKLLYDFGYRTVAINQVINEETVEPKKKKKKGEARDVTDIVPAPFEIKVVEGAEDMKILNRLTVEFSNQDYLYKVIKSTNYKKYHIVAALPTTMSAFMFTCNNFDADILCFDPENKNTLKLTRKLYNQLLDRGYHFEIQYAPAIEDSTKRKNTIHVAHLYHVFGKSRNVIVSSGANKPVQIRGPYDVINLGLIFGLSELQAKNSISAWGKDTYRKSVARRHGKAVMFITNATQDETMSNQEEDAGKVSEEEDMEVDHPAVKKVKH